MLKCKDQIINGQEKGLASFVSSFAIIRKLKTIRSTTKSWMSLLIWMNNGKFVLPGKLESLLYAGGMEFYSLIFRNIKQVDTFGRCHQLWRNSGTGGVYHLLRIFSGRPWEDRWAGFWRIDDVVHCVIHRIRIGINVNIQYLKLFVKWYW